ncbi:FecR family protein [Alistipes montrealensis]|uniref:FecR family protein n=1 Tax=Alistipes montrealensis TaxID=2834113 RepID=UPI001BCB773F|nr:FecR family protein [Alistipes montrealensis]
MEKELLVRFFEGRTTEEEERLILDWLDESPAHREEMLSERRLFDAMLMLVSPEQQVKRKTFTLPRWARQAVGYAAAVLVAAIVGGGYVHRVYDRLLYAGNTISVPAGQRVDVVLPDGTKVCMNALSELKYPGFFAGKYRKVQLSGEAFFEVSHDEEHPFIVETYACDVEVLGTKFDVLADSERNEFVTALVDGKVRVTDRNDPRNQVLLRPDEQVSHINGRLVVDRIPEYEQFQWREGLIAFRDATFMELIEEFEKYYGVKIEVQRLMVPNRFTGKIRIAEGVDHALWVLQQSADFKYTRNEAKDTIYIQ